jgi:hypothetical protein
MEEVGVTADQVRIVGTGLFFLIVFVSGFWLGRSGKPFNGILLTIHKLIALAVAVLVLVTLYRANQVAVLGVAELIAGVISGLFFLGTGVTGGLLSVDKPMPAVVSRLHQIVPFLTLVSTTATLYFLLSR